MRVATHQEIDAVLRFNDLLLDVVLQATGAQHFRFKFAYRQLRYLRCLFLQTYDALGTPLDLDILFYDLQLVVQRQ